MMDLGLKIFLAVDFDWDLTLVDLELDSRQKLIYPTLITRTSIKDLLKFNLLKLRVDLKPQCFKHSKLKQVLNGNRYQNWYDISSSSAPWFKVLLADKHHVTACL